MIYKKLTFILALLSIFLSIWMYNAAQRIRASRAYYYDINVPENINPDCVKVHVIDKGDFCRDSISLNGRKIELRLLADGRRYPKALIFINGINTETIDLVDGYFIYNIK